MKEAIYKVRTNPENLRDLRHAHDIGVIAQPDFFSIAMCAPPPFICVLWGILSFADARIVVNDDILHILPFPLDCFGLTVRDELFVIPIIV